MNETDCARSDLACIETDLRACLLRIERWIGQVREHLATIERETPAPTTAERRRVLRGTSVTADPGSVFLARVDSGDTTAKALKDILDKLSLKVTTGRDSKANGTIRCFSTLEAIHVRNANLVERTLRVIVDAWNGVLVSLRADIVGGVAAFLADAGGIDDRELSRRLSAMNPADVLEATKGDRRRNLPAYLADIYTR